MSDKNYQLIVTMRSALVRVTSDSERLLNKMAPAVAAEDDVGPAVVRRLCNTSLLERLGLTTTEQELVLKAILAAIKEKQDHIPKGRNSGSPLLDMLLNASCITLVQGFSHLGEFGRRMALYDALIDQMYLCMYALDSVQKRQAMQERKQQQQQQQQEQQPLLETGSNHVKLE